MSRRKRRVGHWQLSQADAAMTLPGYRRLSIRSVDYRGYRTAADWQFTYVKDGVTLRVLNRGFVVDDDNGYAIMFTLSYTKPEDLAAVRQILAAGDFKLQNK